MVTPFYFFTFELAFCRPLVIFELGLIFPPNLACSYFVRLLGYFFELLITNIRPSALTNKGYAKTEASVISKY